jgi:hypothetical protein
MSKSGRPSLTIQFLPGLNVFVSQRDLETSLYTQNCPHEGEQDNHHLSKYFLQVEKIERGVLDLIFSKKELCKNLALDIN